MERPRGKRAMLWLLDRATQLIRLRTDPPGPELPTCEAALKTTALAATLLFAHGQTTERTVTAAERLGRALGVTVKVLTKPAKPPPMAGRKKEVLQLRE